MFCPKCGIENPDNGKFCRSCGANLNNVLAAVEGKLALENEHIVANEYAELHSTGVRNTILGGGFFIASILVKKMPGDTFFWLLLMIPAFCLIASGVRRIVKAEAIKKERETKANIIQQPTFSTAQSAHSLPPSQTEYVSPVAGFTTKDLVVPSVTEETTQHLKVEK